MPHKEKIIFFFLNKKKCSILIIININFYFEQKN